MADAVLVRMSPELRRRLGVERRRRGGMTAPETVRAVLDEQLPPAPAAVDPNQLTIAAQEPADGPNSGGTA
jgi:hypothetical protein